MLVHTAQSCQQMAENNISVSTPHSHNVSLKHLLRSVILNTDIVLLSKCGTYTSAAVPLKDTIKEFQHASKFVLMEFHHTEIEVFQA